MNNFDFEKHDILFRCNSCGKEMNIPVDFIPELSSELRVGGTKVKFNPNPEDVRCSRCNGQMHPTIYLPEVIGE